MSADKVVMQAQTWWRSKTIGLGVAMIVLGVLELAQTMDLPPGWVAAIGAAVIALRSITRRPVTASFSARSVQVDRDVSDATGPPSGG